MNTVRIQTKAGAANGVRRLVCCLDAMMRTDLEANNSGLCCPGEKGSSTGKPVEAADVFLGGMPTCLQIVIKLVLSNYTCVTQGPVEL